MNCEVCGRSVLSEPITRKLMWRDRHFCSGRCASTFDRRLFDPRAELEEVS
ncbi:MAG: TRASH domain-containing protein [Halobacteria archaeon]